MTFLAPVFAATAVTATVLGAGHTLRVWLFKKSAAWMESAPVESFAGVAPNSPEQEARRKKIAGQLRSARAWMWGCWTVALGSAIAAFVV